MAKKKTNKIQFHPKLGIFPQLQRRYVTIIALIIVILILTPKFLTGNMLVNTFAIFGLMAGAMVLLTVNFRWQRISRYLRPYIVTRILQIIACVAIAWLAYITIQDAMVQDNIPAYSIYWILLLVLAYQYFDIFNFAKRAKAQDETRCDFC